MVNVINFNSCFFKRIKVETVITRLNNLQQTKKNQKPTNSSPPYGCRSPLNLLLVIMKTIPAEMRVSSCIQPCHVLLPGRRGVTLGKPDIKVETINKETHSLEEDSGSVSTASRMVKAMYSVSSSRICVLGLDTVYTACSCRKKKLRLTQ